MRFFAMPDGNVWELYADLLTVPESTEEPKQAKKVHLSPQVIQTFTRFTGRLYVPPEEEDEEAPEEDDDEETGDAEDLMLPEL